jgi:Uma2 family endonuclease
VSTALHLTLAEYERMVNAGAFEELRDKRLEFIRGELREMSPQGTPHFHAVLFLSQWSYAHFTPAQVAVVVQSPLRIPALQSVPEPDVYWTLPISDKSRIPEAHEIFLIIEVSGRSLTYDLGEKALLYSQAGINDYWVVDLRSQSLHVFRQPTSEGHVSHETFRQGEVASLAFPHVKLVLSELFGA